MELFSEIKNRYFQLMFRIINECAGGKTKNEIMRIIDEGEFEQKVIGKNQKSFADFVLNKCEPDENFNLLTEKNGMYYPSIEIADKSKGTESDTAKHNNQPPLPVRFSIIEKAWLKALLDKEGVKMVLSKETYDKLQKELADIDTPIKDEYFELTNTIKLPAITDQDAYEANFRLLLNAIIQEKPIRYNNTDRNGNIYSNRLALPVSIEYSMRDGRFRVSMYLLDENRPIMANIFTLSDIRIVDEEGDIDRETAKRLLFEQKHSEEPIVLEVTDKKAAMERCFMCFSGMERTARSLGNNKYEIRLNYYLFEEENLIRNIISLGPYVKVISPQRIADEIIARVKKSISLYNI
ncbi:WYL domain-containing protein [Acetivibrio mesophilus]|uniref:WYL domain-containing protein n=1 Tax=Acetivibrio mesophilus TaxID=2487273 RepID=A0A4Q0I354_9FIRM|nr:WYL domain-containing protein [Acetivibrio mesophilus]RXE58601.1 WYL domain-containing protein [Acetivibrio mesophilus]